MKKLLTLLVILLISSYSFAQKQINIEPMFKLGIYTNKSMKIYDPNIEYGLPFRYDNDKKIDYHINTGFRVNYKNFSLESENVFYVATDNFINNFPYSAEFFIRAYYKHKKFKIGYEHVCIHPITSDAFMGYEMIGEYDKFYISFNY